MVVVDAEDGVPAGIRCAADSATSILFRQKRLIPLSGHASLPETLLSIVPAAFLLCPTLGVGNGLSTARFTPSLAIRVKLCRAGFSAS